MATGALSPHGAAAQNLVVARRARAAAAIVVTAVVVARSARAHTVLCFGDSTSWLYPARLQALRPDLRVVNGALPGDVSTNAPRLRALLDRDRPDDVVIMIGTNDVIRRDGNAIVTDDPAVTFRNIARLARLARHGGARVVVLTQTPATCAGSCAERQPFTRDVAHRLVAWDLTHPRRIAVADLRDEFTTHSWYDLSADGLHPNVAGADFIAAFVAARIP